MTSQPARDVAMKRRKAVLIALVHDLLLAGYTPSDVARAVGRSPQRIAQIATDLRLSRPKLRTLDDLDPPLRARVIAYRDLKVSTESC